jgi:hypothetical protein
MVPFDNVEVITSKILRSPSWLSVSSTLPGTFLIHDLSPSL